MANSVDPDQTAPSEAEAVWSGSTLIVQTCVRKLKIITEFFTDTDNNIIG